MQFKEFKEYKNPIENIKYPNTQENKKNENFIEKTPIETIEYNFNKLNNKLAKELLDEIKSKSPEFFERLVVDLLTSMGYGGSRKDAGRAIGKSGDEGIDGIINEDVLGLDTIYIQAKRWKDNVSRPEIQKFSGALNGKNANKGVFITTSSFSEGAKDFAKGVNQTIILIDGEKLAQLMMDFKVGVSIETTYEVKKLDLDYFEDE